MTERERCEEVAGGETKRWRDGEMKKEEVRTMRRGERERIGRVPVRSRQLILSVT